MVDPSDIAGDVITGATALAGLILVYLGSIATGYGSYDVTQQHSVMAAYQRRAWFGFVGFVLALLAAAAALVGKWWDLDCLTTVAAVVLLFSFGLGIATALLTVLEVK
jgi:hypothetical protein